MSMLPCAVPSGAAPRGGHCRHCPRTTVRTWRAGVALQVASRDADPDLPLLARVDALLGARVTALFAGTRDELGMARRQRVVAAA